jgi:hypothetical protein
VVRELINVKGLESVLGLDRVTAEERAADGFGAMLEELDRKVSGGTLLTDEGKGVITGRQWRASAIPFEWKSLPQFVAFARLIWFRRCFTQARRHESIDLNESNIGVGSPIALLLSGGAAVVSERDQISLLINSLAWCAGRLSTRARAQSETIEWIILWVKCRVANCGTRYQCTPPVTLVDTAIEELLVCADLVEFHADHESLVNFLMEQLGLSRNTVDQRLGRLREVLQRLHRQYLVGGDPPEKDDEDAGPG